MPKKHLAWDTPLWDTMIDEFGDPRPYQPAVPEFTESYRPDDEPVVDPDYFDELLYEVGLQVDAALEAFDGWRELADDAMDKIWPWPVRRTASLDAVAREHALALLSSADAPTIIRPHTGDVDDDVTQEIPVVRS